MGLHHAPQYGRGARKESRSAYKLVRWNPTYRGVSDPRTKENLGKKVDNS